MSVVYLLQSLRPQEAETSEASSSEQPGFFQRHLNAFVCFGIFALFLLTLDYLGMLIGGVLFVFLTLSALGNRTPGDILKHALIAVISIGAMWAIFTFGLRVFLPEGELLRIW